jgi:hypothetical protein
MTNEEWFEMVGDEGQMPFVLEILNIELGQLPVLRQVVSEYDDLRLSSISSWDEALPLHVTVAFVQNRSIDEQIALMERLSVAAMVDVIMSYASESCREDVVSALSSTANALL